MAEINIRKMTIEDLELISPILSSEFDDFWNIENLKSELTNTNSYCYIAELENNIVGFASLWHVIDTVHLNDIVVRKKYRNLGIGSIFLEHLINISSKIEGVTSITLEVSNKNLPAQKLYLKYGFKELGIRKNYYSQNENAIIMTKYF